MKIEDWMLYIEIPSSSAPCPPSTQADEQPYLHVLSSIGTSVQAAFYGAEAAELAERHPAVAALLRAAKKPRNGCYKAATADLVAEANAPPHQVWQ
jgi:hypothetical protein